MSDPWLAELPIHPVQELLEAHFSERTLSELLGAEAGTLGRNIWHRALAGPISSFVARPGKALRAELVAICFELAGGTPPCPPRLGAIIEILHAGSLIVDDIEDGSPSRRGGPALHRSHGVPVALNAGNWMYFWALGLIEQVTSDPGVQLRLYQWAQRVLLRCHHGQALDLTANVYELSRAELPALVLATAELKTGALTELAAVLGAVMAGAGPELVRELAVFGRSVGVALQMLDDVGGLVSEKRCHKGHEDLLLGRPTWPWAWLSAELPEPRFEQLRQRGRDVAARELHPEVLARPLRSHLRGSGRVRVRRHLHRAFAQLKAAVGPHAALSTLQAQLWRMEKSYG